MCSLFICGLAQTRGYVMRALMVRIVVARFGRGIYFGRLNDLPGFEAGRYDIAFFPGYASLCSCR